MSTLTEVDAVESVAAMLEAAGWQREGETSRETVRIPTSRAPVFGGIGGELRTWGGRLRFHLPNTDRWVTVGARTVNFYTRADGSEPHDFEQFKTSDREGIAGALA